MVINLFINIIKFTINISEIVINTNKQNDKVYGFPTDFKLRVYSDGEWKNVIERTDFCTTLEEISFTFEAEEAERVELFATGLSENENIEKAREEILRQLDEIKNGNITDEELEHARMAVQNSYNSIGDSAHGVAGWYIDHIIKNDIETPAQALEKYLAVSKERIIEAAKSMVLDTVYVLTSLEDDGKEQD